MNFGFIHQAQQSLNGPALPGCWKLGAKQALTLAPRQDAVLKVMHGCLWVTLGQAPRGPGGEDSGDFFLQAGEQITVQAGESAVIESSGPARDAPVYFNWDPMPAVVHQALRPAARWQLTVVQPLADLRYATALGLAAIGRLALGIIPAWRGPSLRSTSYGGMRSSM